MFRLLNAWFDPVEPSNRYGIGHYLVLLSALIVGALIRFWGLDNVGLHGDEETMALPALAILESGQPLLPSGMFYARALLEIYLMAGSVAVFGESEWAFRFPSAIAGTLMPVAAFFAGKRFLEPNANLALVVVVVLLPAFITISQTARMYVFFVACVFWFTACIFRWERDGKYSSLLIALLVWLLALHFHRLAILVAPLFLFPGLSKSSYSILLRGGVAFAIGYGFYAIYQNWISGKYPQSAERPPKVPEAESTIGLDILAANSSWVVISIIVALTACIITSAWVLRRSSPAGLLPLLFLGFGLLGLITLNYHAAAIALLIGSIIWVRNERLPVMGLAVIIVLAGIIAIGNFGLIYQSEEFPGRKVIGAVVGVPSIWPTLIFAGFSPGAALLSLVALGWILVRFASGHAMPVVSLLFGMMVWAPLLLLGVLLWYLPPRYTFGQLPFFLIFATFSVAYLQSRTEAKLGKPIPSAITSGGWVVAVAVMVNPIALAAAISPAYGEYPDHKGAAEFVLAQPDFDDAVVIAEDVLQMAYYVGDVDYSLRAASDARVFSYVQDGVVRDQYTSAIVLRTGRELLDALDRHSNDVVYLIGSGENFVNGRRVLRTTDIREALQSERLAVVYEGRDGKTRVWKLQ